MTRVYLPSSLPSLGEAWDAAGPADLVERVAAPDDSEEGEYAALSAAAEASAALVAGLPDGARRRVVVVAEPRDPDGAVAWADVVAVHLDDGDDADPDDDLGWYAVQEVGELIAHL